MEIYTELDENRAKIESVFQIGAEFVRKSGNQSQNLQHNLKTLKTRWENVNSRANDKKIKLEIALKEAIEFHNALQNFVNWLTNAEKVLNNLKPVSRVLETILTQIDDHKNFQKDISINREIILNLDKKGTHLKYFSQKQDVILIKNLLISVQHRWDRIISKSSERTRNLDIGLKETKEFYDSYHNLMSWILETKNKLTEEVQTNPERVKHELTKQQEITRLISAKQSIFDQTMKVGKLLKDKAPKSDENTLKNMLIELKNSWNELCTKNINRQRSLEEALLFSGQFKDAILAIITWLKKAEANLVNLGPLYGDLDTVNSIVEQHKNFESDLKNRGEQKDSVVKTGRELEVKASVQDSEVIREQLGELNSLWNDVSRYVFEVMLQFYVYKK